MAEAEVRISIAAASIVQGGRIDLAAGLLSLRATSGDVILTSGSVTRAAGVIRPFFDQSLAVAGGRITLTADQGRVDAMAGSLVDLSGNGAKAGTLAIVSSQAVRLDGALRGDGGGNFMLDTGAVPSFATLADKLAASGFNGDLSVRLRAGDLTIDGTTRASSFSLAADAGSITVTGTIDVSGAAGGVIVLSVKNDLTVAAGARLSANAGDAGERSGLIELSSTDGSMDLRAGARIETVGGRSGNGDIKLRFRRDNAGSVKLVNAAATMTAARIIAEAYRDGYVTTSVDAMLPAALADAATFNVAIMPSWLVSRGRPIYLDQLVAFMRQATGNALLSDAAALDAIRDARFADYRKILINAVLSKELRAAGRGKVDGLGAGLGYERGYAAIATLYPGAERKDNTGWQGDVIMDVSKIRTYLGGNLDITAPGGNLQVSALSSTGTGPNNGVLTINGGEIRILTGLDTMINTSRILTARGGDVTIWSSYGDIDAGKGKKSALTNPPVTYAISTDGNISYTINPSFSGSGISTQKGAPDAPVSSVDLYAPDGIINAGDAGIRSSGAIYLGALEIRGAENIRADGEIKGVPKPATSVASLNLETKDKAAADVAKDTSQSGVREQPSVIIVEVLGYGGGEPGTPSLEEQEEERKRRRGQNPQQGNYNPNSIFRVVGSGELTVEQKQKLTSEERANLNSR